MEFEIKSLRKLLQIVTGDWDALCKVGIAFPLGGVDVKIVPGSNDKYESIVCFDPDSKCLVECDTGKTFFHKTAELTKQLNGYVNKTYIGMSTILSDLDLVPVRDVVKNWSHEDYEWIIDPSKVSSYTTADLAKKRLTPLQFCLFSLNAKQILAFTQRTDMANLRGEREDEEDDDTLIPPSDLLNAEVLMEADLEALVPSLFVLESTHGRINCRDRMFNAYLDKDEGSVMVCYADVGGEFVEKQIKGKRGRIDREMRKCYKKSRTY